MPSTTAQHGSRASRAVAGWLVAVAAVAGAGVAIGVAGGVAQGDSPRGSGDATASAPAPTTPPNAEDHPIAVPPVVPPAPVVFTFVAAGDVLPHTPVIASARTGSGYDFVPLMENVAPYIEGADLAVCHLETPVAPPGTQPSGYPMFSTPKEIVANLGEVGWDGCSTASNHSVDRGFAGVEATLDEFQKQGMGHSGTARTEGESTQTQMYNVMEGDRIVKVANISYTYGLNGLPKPDGKPWAVNTFNAEAANVQPILDAAQHARSQGADVVIASVHCCVEYLTEPLDAQASIVSQIAESGLVDLYVGHHAHVPQPIRKLDGGPGGDGMWAAYGLGNFISNQSADCCVPQTSNGVLLSSTFTVDPDGSVSVEVAWTAVTVDRGDSHTMYVMTPSSGKLGSLSASEVAARHGRVADAVGSQAPELTEPVAHLADAMWITERKP